jgi:uncharacterized membrane protein YphA (DoxX/SURF4 family)
MDLAGPKGQLKSHWVSGRLPDLIGLLARLILGVVLIWAGAIKVTAPAKSALAVRAFQILNYDVAGYVGYALPVVEILVGILLVAGLLTRVSALAGGLLMLAFIIGISSAWARGLSIDCGCFGGGGTIAASQTQYLKDILRDVGLVACAAWLVVRPRTAYSLDRRLFG